MWLVAPDTDRTVFLFWEKMPMISLTEWWLYGETLAFTVLTGSPLWGNTSYHLLEVNVNINDFSHRMAAFTWHLLPEGSSLLDKSTLVLRENANVNDFSHWMAALKWSIGFYISHVITWLLALLPQQTFSSKCNYWDFAVYSYHQGRVCSINQNYVCFLICVIFLWRPL